jgi:hypothetical protein
MRLCRSCLQLRRALRAGFCESCVMSTPREIARQHDRRIRQLRRHRWLLMQDLKATEFVTQESGSELPRGSTQSIQQAGGAREIVVNSSSSP